MIAIINRGGDEKGECNYTVQINRRIITEFTHNRPDGLATCLEKAALAIRKQEARVLQLLLKEERSIEP